MFRTTKTVEKSLQRLLVTTTKNTINGKRVRLEKAQDALLSLDTSRIVARGYATIVKKDDKPLTSTRILPKVIN